MEISNAKIQTLMNTISFVEADSFEIDPIGRITVKKDGTPILVSITQNDENADSSHNWFTVLNEKSEAVGVYQLDMPEGQRYQNVKLGIIFGDEVNYQ